MASILFVSACDKEEAQEESPVASFQSAVSADNFLEVTFTNFSLNADTYAWDFGDGNTSTEKDPTHTYAEAGTYDVTLSATGNGETATRVETINIVDPDQALTLLAGATSKTWYLQREGVALGVGSAANSNEYWSFGGVTPLGDRPCILDDQYIFHRDGTFEFNSNNTIFIDAAANGGWLDPSLSESCYDEDPSILTSVNGDDLSAFGNGGSYTYEFDNTTNSLTLVGLGAYVGLPNKTADGDNFIPQASKTYTIFNFVEGDIADSLGIALVGGATWNFYLVSYHDEANLPAIPTALPTANFSFAKDGNTVTFTNTSVNSDTYAWDFGDGVTSNFQNPSHIYGEINDFDVTLLVENNGCFDSIHANISFGEPLIYYVPNAFTPDADGFNHVFQPIFTSGFSPFKYHLYIYNRWGELIFESLDHTAPWDGTYNGRICPQGAYTWKIEFGEELTDKRHVALGHVMLLK